MQYPGSIEACEAVTDAAGSLPWALLGGSEISGEQFARQLHAACLGGASGFMAGRSI